ncbi:MAG TPA: hypothetical protein VD788_08350 [Candidatus Polarisedimenticolaceae bacterium]|nr:hypothetical protein [Candidatus Polarisedimenticolaceae bacterium]
MKRNLSWIAACFAVSVLALIGSAPVHAQATGQTAVSVDIPDIVILHYFSSVDVTIDANTMGSFLTGTPGNAGTVNEGVTSGLASLSGSNLQVDLAMTPSALTGDPSAAVLVLQNAWAVRAISLGNLGSSTELDIAITGATMSNGGSQIGITTATVNDGTSNASTITFPAPGLAPALQGDVELTLSFANAVDAGPHTGGEFTLTATNL